MAGTRKAYFVELGLGFHRPGSAERRRGVDRHGLGEHRFEPLDKRIGTEVHLQPEARREPHAHRFQKAGNLFRLPDVAHALATEVDGALDKPHRVGTGADEGETVEHAPGKVIDGREVGRENRVDARLAHGAAYLFKAAEALLGFEE